jgi:hypothetical protein
MRLCLKHVYVRLVYDYVVWGDLNQFSYIYDSKSKLNVWNDSRFVFIEMRKVF